PQGNNATDALIKLRHAPSLATIAARLPALLESRGPLKWDPHHVGFELSVPLRAIFAMDPATATERFAPYFTDEALAGDSGAQLAHSILSVGRRVLVDHNGTQLGTGDRDYLALDPRWLEIAKRLVGHRRLHKIAAELLQRAGIAVPKQPAA